MDTKEAQDIVDDYISNDDSDEEADDINGSKDGFMNYEHDKGLIIKVPETQEADKPDENDPAQPLLSNGSDSDFQRQPSQAASEPKTPADRVRFILSPDKAGGKDSDSSDSDIGLDILEAHALFCQLDVLCHFEDGDIGWKEMSRWLKYEEKVEGGDRWSKPHVATSSLHSLFEIRKGIAEGDTIVDLEMNATHGCVHQVADQSNPDIHKAMGDLAENVVSLIKAKKNLPQEQLDKILEVLVAPHKHKHRKGDKTKDSNNKAGNIAQMKVVDETGKSSGNTNAAKNGKDKDVKNNNLLNKQDSSDSDKKKKKKGLKKKGELKEISALHHSYAGGLKPDALKPYKPNKKLMKKIPGGSEVANLLVGQVDFLEEPIQLFIRLGKGSMLGDLTEVSLPTRFLYILLGPPESTSIWEYEEVGRSMAALLSDKVFCEVAYKAATCQDLVDGIDEYIDDLTVLPPSIWDPATRLDPPDTTMSMTKIRKRLLSADRHNLEPDKITHEDTLEEAGLFRTGKFFGGMMRDMKRRYKYMASDYKDAMHQQSIAAIVFLYFACITPIVTFGGLMGTATNGLMGTMECLLSGAICGILFALFGGQPLTILGATGPLLIFESILYTFCQSFELDFLGFRFWVGTWITFILIVMVAFDLSALVKYITRFTEESFSVLISLIFIMEAFKKLIHVWDTHPIHTKAHNQDPSYVCHCVQGNSSNVVVPMLADPHHAPHGEVAEAAENATTREPYSFWNWTQVLPEDCITYTDKLIVNTDCVSEYECLNNGWTTEGPACGVATIVSSVPDVFLLSCFLFLGTFGVAYFFRSMRTSRCFPSIVRSTFADFAVLISILLMTGIDIGMGIDTPKLLVPSEFKTTVDGRGWLINPMRILPYWYLIILACLPAALATILIFLDQQITAVIINRKEHKLKKPPGFHLDLFWLAITIFICSLLGLPWFVAATVRSITHVKALLRESEVNAPGEKSQMMGVREQRFTALMIHILIALSVLMTSILKYVPMPVLFGVFLYMGVTSLSGVQFTQRVSILLMPRKYQPDYVFLRHVETKRVHIFTGIQIILMVAMWIVKSIKSIAIAFPLLILALAFVRKGMDYFFTQGELFWLDHLMPESDRRKKEDEMLAEGDASADEKEPVGWPEEPKRRARSASIPEKLLQTKSQPEVNFEQMVAKRDYNVGRKFRPRDKSKKIINRYRGNKPKDEEEEKPEGTEGDLPFEGSFAERKFSL